MPEMNSVIVSHDEQPAPMIAGHWIWDVAAQPGGEVVTCLFRRDITAEDLADGARLHVSADGRYRAYLNGKLISRGPCRGTPEHYHYETVDLAGLLTPGKNVLAVEVRYYGRHQPVAEVHREPGMWAMVGPKRDGEWILPDAQWKALRPGAQSPHPIDSGKVCPGYVVVDPCEDLDLRKMPAGWTQVNFDDSAWTPAVPGQAAIGRYTTGPFSEFYRELIPRQIPPMEEAAITPVGVTERGRISPAAAPEQARSIDGQLTPLDGPTEAFWGPGGRPLRLDGSGTDYLIVNMGELTTGYPRLTVDAPAGTLVEFRYCEALSRDRRKAVRDDPAAGTVEGYFDLFTCAAGENVIESFVWRTFRFLRIAIHHPAGPVTLRSLETTFTGYPYQMRASFESSDPLHKQLWDVSWRTARLCAHEHYEDCPYYEQLQYTGDTRLQGLVAYMAAGDFRLVRQALRQYAWSRRADGILLSRTPSNEWKPQIIPGFSLIWVEFLEDYVRHSGDLSLAAELFATAEGVLAWFDQFDKDGVLQGVPYWLFSDWSLPCDWTPASGNTRMAGSVGELNIRRAGAMKAAARMARMLGRTQTARDLDRRVRLAVEGIKKQFWSKEAGLFCDNAEGLLIGEHASLLAIYHDLVTQAQGRSIIRRLQKRKDLARTTIYWSYYTFRAYEKLGIWEQAYARYLSNWTEPLKLHASTWFEQPEPSRSDCHAWGSWIMCDLLTSVLGIAPAEAGFASVRIAPNLLDLQWARGTMPTVRGPVSVEWKREGEQVRCKVTLPEGVSGTLVSPAGEEQPLSPGVQEITFSAKG